MTGELDYMMLIGQGVGVLAFCVASMKNFKKKKSDILKLSIVAYAIYIVHYFMIGAIAGSYTLILALLRDTYMFKRETHHKKHRHRKLYNNPLFFILLFSAYTTLIILNIHTPVNTLPLFAGVTYLSFEWFTTNKTTLKIAGGFTTLPWVFFDLISFSIAGFVSDSISLVVCAAGVLKDKKLRRKVVKHNH
jgi:hypothetical protein